MTSVRWPFVRQWPAVQLADFVDEAPFFEITRTTIDENGVMTIRDIDPADFYATPEASQ